MGLAQDQTNPVLRRFQQQMAVDLRTEAGDNHARHVLQRKGPIYLPRRSAGDLTIAAPDLAPWTINGEDVISHTRKLSQTIVSQPTKFFQYFMENL